MKKRNVILLALAFLGVMFAWLYHLQTRRSEIGQGGPAEIQLIGVRPNAGREMFDIYGKKIEPLEMPSFITNSFWGETLCREFIFEIPKGVLMDIQKKGVGIFPSGDSTKISHNLDRKIIKHKGKRYLVVSTTFAKGYVRKFLFWLRNETVDSVDIDLSYLYGSDNKTFKTSFRNIEVVYPSVKDIAYLPYLDEMIKRLKLDNSDTVPVNRHDNYQFKSSQEAIKVIDIIELRHIRSAINALQRDRYNLPVLDQADAERVRKTALKWIDNGYVSEGLRLGLTFKFEEFYEPAIHAIENWDDIWFEEGREFAGGLSEVMSLFGQLVRDMGRYDIDRLGKIIKDSDKWIIRESLCYILKEAMEKGDKRAGEVLLELANDDRCWMWWLPSKLVYRCRDKLFESDEDIPTGLMDKMIIANSLPNVTPVQNRAYGKLGDYFTLETANKGFEAFHRMQCEIVRGVGREKGAKIFVDLFREVLEAEYVDESLHHRICDYVRLINYWYDVDLGGLGRKNEPGYFEKQPKTFNGLKKVLSEAVEWFDSGNIKKPRVCEFPVTVVDKKKNALEGAKLTVYETVYSDDFKSDPSRGRMVGEAFANAKGEILFKGLGSKFNYTGVFSADGYLSREMKIYQDANYGDYLVYNNGVVELLKPGIVRGTALDSEGKPLAGAKMRLYSDRSYTSGQTERVITADENGRFEIKDIKPALHFLCYPDNGKMLGGGDGVDGRFVASWIDIDEGGEVDFVMDLSKMSVSEFKVTDSEGGAVEDIKLAFRPQLRSGWNTQDSKIVFTFEGQSTDGIYRFEALPKTSLIVYPANERLERFNSNGYWYDKGYVWKKEIKLKKFLK